MSNTAIMRRLDEQREAYGIVGWGVPGFVKKAARGVARGVKKAVKKTVKKGYSLSKNPIIQTAVATTVPGGVGIVAGLKAVQMVDKARRGDAPSLEQMAEIASAASQGNKTAQAALETLRAANRGVKASVTLAAAKLGDNEALQHIANLKRLAQSGHKTAAQAFGVFKELNGKVQAVSKAAASNPAAFNAVLSSSGVTLRLKAYPMAVWAKWA